MRVPGLAVGMVLFGLLCPAASVAAPRYDVLIVKDTSQKGQTELARAARRNLEKIRADLGLSSQDLPVDEYDVHVAGQAVALQRLKLRESHGPLVAICSMANGKPAKVLQKYEAVDGQFQQACLMAMGYASHVLGKKLPFLGVAASELTKEVRGHFHIADDAAGVCVVHVSPGSPAEAAGVREGDVLETIGDTAVSSPEAMTSLVHLHKSGDSLHLKVLRAGQEVTLSVTLGEVPTH